MYYAEAGPRTSTLSSSLLPLVDAVVCQIACLNMTLSRNYNLRAHRTPIYRRQFPDVIKHLNGEVNVRILDVSLHGMEM
jgi:hypothetical protein